MVLNNDIYECEGSPQARAMRQSARVLSTLGCAYLCNSCAAPQQGARSAFIERQRVGELIASFSASVAQRDFQAMSAFFAEDAIWETSAGTLGFRHEGRAVIHGWLTSNPGHVEVVFYLASTPSVELLSSDRARAQTSITELIRFQ